MFDVWEAFWSLCKTTLLIISSKGTKWKLNLGWTFALIFSLIEWHFNNVCIPLLLLILDLGKDQCLTPGVFSRGIEIWKDISQVVHCVKSVQIRGFFWSIFSYILSEYRKTWTRKSSVFGSFHAVIIKHFSFIGVWAKILPFSVKFIISLKQQFIW